MRVYTNGSAIHRIAVFYGGKPCKAAGGVVVWIDNSLDDKLSPETMISIAKSLKPARRARRPDPRHGADSMTQRAAGRHRRWLRRPRDGGVLRARPGYDVVCLDIDEAKLARLRAGEAPIHEPGVEELLAGYRERLSVHVVGVPSCSRAPTSPSCASTRRRARPATPI